MHNNPEGLQNNPNLPQTWNWNCENMLMKDQELNQGILSRENNKPSMLMNSPTQETPKINKITAGNAHQKPSRFSNTQESCISMFTKPACWRYYKMLWEIGKASRENSPLRMLLNATKCSQIHKCVKASQEGAGFIGLGGCSNRN